VSGTIEGKVNACRFPAKTGAASAGAVTVEVKNPSPAEQEAHEADDKADVDAKPEKDPSD